MSNNLHNKFQKSQSYQHPMQTIRESNNKVVSSGGFDDDFDPETNISTTRDNNIWSNSDSWTTGVYWGPFSTRPERPGFAPFFSESDNRTGQDSSASIGSSPDRQATGSKVTNTSNSNTDSWTTGVYWGPFSKPEERNEHFSRPGKFTKGHNEVRLAEDTATESKGHPAKRPERPDFAPFFNESDNRTGQDSSASIGSTPDRQATGSKVTNTSNSNNDSWTTGVYWGPFSKPEERNEHFSRPGKFTKGHNEVRLAEDTATESKGHPAKRSERLDFAPFFSESDNRTGQDSSASIGSTPDRQATGSKVTDTSNSNNDSWTTGVYWGPFSKPEERNEHFSRPGKFTKGHNEVRLAEDTATESKGHPAKRPERLDFAPFFSESDNRTGQDSSASIGSTPDRQATGSKVTNTSNSNTDSWTTGVYWGPFSKPEERNEHFSRPGKFTKGHNEVRLAEDTATESKGHPAKRPERPDFAPFFSESDNRTGQDSSASIGSTPDRQATGSKVTNTSNSNTDSWKRLLLTPFSNKQGGQNIRLTSDAASARNASDSQGIEIGAGINGSNLLSSLNTGDEGRNSNVEDSFFKRPKFIISFNSSELPGGKFSDSLSDDLKQNIPTHRSQTSSRSSPAHVPLQSTENEVVDLTDSPSSSMLPDNVAQIQLTKSQKRRLSRKRKRMRKKLKKLRENINESEYFENVQERRVEVIDLLDDSEEDGIAEHRSSSEVSFDHNNVLGLVDVSKKGGIGEHNRSSEVPSDHNDVMELGLETQEDETKFNQSENPYVDNALLGIETGKRIAIDDDFAIDRNNADHKPLIQLEDDQAQRFAENVGKLHLDRIKMKLTEKKSELERAKLLLSVAQTNKSEALIKAKAQLAAAWKRKEMALKAKLSKQNVSAAKVAVEQCAAETSLNSPENENQHDERVDVQAFSMKSLLISNIGSHPNERHRQLHPRGYDTVSNKEQISTTTALPRNKADILRLELELAKRRLKLAELQKMKKLRSTSVVVCNKDVDKITDTENNIEMNPRKTQSIDRGDVLDVASSTRIEVKDFDGSLLLGMIHKQQSLLRKHKESLHLHTSSLQECQTFIGFDATEGGDRENG